MSGKAQPIAAAHEYFPSLKYAARKPKFPLGKDLSKEVSVTTLLIIVVLFLLLGGGGYYGFRRW
jgi:hypothetical protein